MINKSLVPVAAVGLLAGCLLAPALVRADRRMADRIVERTNQERRAKGLPQLKVNAKLNAAALAHVRNMARQGNMNHVLDGNGPAQRITQADYSWSWCGENIAYGYDGDRSGVAGWMVSPGHRRNILSKEFTEIGVAVAYSAEGTPYYCQVFGRPPCQER